MKLLGLVFALLTSGNGYPVASHDHEDGIYLTEDCVYPGQKQRSIVLLPNKKHVCIPDKPLIDMEGIQSTQDMIKVPDQNLISFKIVLTPDAFQKLKTISVQLPLTTYAFVFKKDIMFTFTIEPAQLNRMIELRGKLHDKKINTFYEQLQKALMERS